MKKGQLHRLLKAESDSKMRMVLCLAKVVFHPDIEKTTKNNKSAKQRPKGPPDTPKSESIVKHSKSAHGTGGWSKREGSPPHPPSTSSPTNQGFSCMDTGMDVTRRP